MVTVGGRLRCIGSRSAALSEEAAGGLVVVAEGVGDDAGGKFEELLSDGGAAGGCDRDTDLAQECGHVVGTGRSTSTAAGSARSTVLSSLRPSPGPSLCSGLSSGFLISAVEGNERLNAGVPPVEEHRPPADTTTATRAYRAPSTVRSTNGESCPTPGYGQQSTSGQERGDFSVVDSENIARTDDASPSR